MISMVSMDVMSSFRLSIDEFRTFMLRLRDCSARIRLSRSESFSGSTSGRGGRALGAISRATMAGEGGGSGL